MSRIEFEVTEEMKEQATKKAEELIECLSEYKDPNMKAYILFNLVDAFKDVSGIDITKWMRYEETQKEDIASE